MEALEGRCEGSIVGGGFESFSCMSQHRVYHCFQGVELGCVGRSEIDVWSCDRD